MVIRHTSFGHKGGFYHYRIHNLKLSNLCKDNLFNLKLYLEKMFEKCPHEYFDSGPRGSSLKFKLNLENQTLGWQVFSIRVKIFELAKCWPINQGESLTFFS